MKFFISNNKKLPPAAQKQFLPRKEFMTQGKERFLASFDASTLARNAHPTRGDARPAYVTAFFKIGVGMLAILCVGVGLSAYADTADVPATSPLYPLKRLSENVQLALAPTAEKSELQATFAVRRANEIAALQVSQPSSTLIPALTSDLDQDISSSLGSVPGTNIIGSVSEGGNGNSRNNGGHGYNNGGGIRTLSSSPTSTPTSPHASSSVSASADIGPISVYCSAFDVSTSGVLIGHLESNLTLRPGAFAQFNQQCGSDSRNGGNNNASSTGQQHVVTGQDEHGRHVAGGSAAPAPAPSSSSRGGSGYGFPSGYPRPGAATSTVNVHASFGL